MMERTGVKLLYVEECFFQTTAMAVIFSPQTVAESNKACSGCQRGGVKEVVGVACVPLNCFPSMLPSYSWNVSLIVPLKVTFSKEQAQRFVYFRAKMQFCLLAVRKSTLDVC